MEKGKPTFGSLFAGVGGFDIGLENAGWQCGFQVEWDKNCQQVLAYHWPEVPRWWDVSDVNGAELPPVDMITFGSPCQDLSLAGKRKGLQGERSGLFFQATRIIREMRNATGNAFPRYALWENVVGALSSNNGDDFEAVIREMADMGSDHIEWCVLDAQFFGVPQRRRRVFVLACFDTATSERSGRQVFAVGESRTRNFATSGEPGQNIARQTAHSLRTNDQQLDLFAESTYGTYAEGVGTLRASSGTVGGGSETLVVGTLCASDWKGVGNQYVADGKIVVQ